MRYWYRWATLAGVLFLFGLMLLLFLGDIDVTGRPDSSSVQPVPPGLSALFDDPRRPQRPALRKVPPVQPPAIRSAAVVQRIPVLMYHEIGDKPNGNYLRYADFEAQMRWLAENGYQTVTLEEVYRHLNDFTPLPPKPVVLTFDDGYRSFYTAAVPVLKRNRFRATVFIITGLVDHPEHMTWEQIKELPTMGMEVGAHTVTHSDLRQMTGAKLRWELAESKRILEERIGLVVRFFCYPTGRYNQETPEVVKAVGYLGAVTTEYGPVTPKQSPFLWSRIRISRGDTVALMVRKIQGAIRTEP